MFDYKNQHYLPQFYLKGFTDPAAPGQLQVLKKGHQHWMKRGTKNVASEEYLHSFKEENGEMNHDVEKTFSQVEGLWKPILDKILHGDRSRIVPELTLEEEGGFAYFVMAMWHRVPSQVEHWNNQWSEVMNFALRIQQAHDPKLKDVDLDANKVQMNPLLTLLSSMGAAMKLAVEIVPMEWRFVYTTPPHFFITSDHPVALVDPTKREHTYGTGLMHENAELTLPLSREMCFFGGWKSHMPELLRSTRAVLPAPDGFVEQINQRTVMAASREIIAPRREFPSDTKIISEWISQTS